MIDLITDFKRFHLTQLKSKIEFSFSNRRNFQDSLSNFLLRRTFESKRNSNKNERQFWLAFFGYYGRRFVSVSVL